MGFHGYLIAQQSLPPSLLLKFEGLLDSVDVQVQNLNSHTHEIASSIREKGGSIVEECGVEERGFERSAVGRAAAVPLGELKVLLAGLESGSVHHEKPPPPLPPEVLSEDPATKVAALLSHMTKQREAFLHTHHFDASSSPLPSKAPVHVSPTELKGLREERRSLEIELLAAHKAIGALESKLTSLRERGVEQVVEKV